MTSPGGLTHITVTTEPMDRYKTWNPHKYACPNCAAGIWSPAGSHVAIRFQPQALTAALSEVGWTDELWAAELRVRLTLYQLFDQLSRQEYCENRLCCTWMSYQTDTDEDSTTTAGLVVPDGELAAWATAIGHETAHTAWSPLAH